MKKTIIFYAALILILAMCINAKAVQLYADSAPNVYGSPDWAPWWTLAKADVVAGTFTNMRTGMYPGTTEADPYDEIVYSTMDLGKRLHWIYWLPGETVAGLDGLFEVKWVIDWEGDAWTYEGGGWALDGPDVGWTQPSSWEDYSGGVIGSLGFAWWATDDEAEPFDTGGSLYDEVDQADIDALRLVVLDAQTYATGMVRYRIDENSPWECTSFNIQVVPEPTTICLLGLGGLALLRRKRGYGA